MNKEENRKLFDAAARWMAAYDKANQHQIDTPEEERRTPLDEERASFHRETLERRHDE